MKELELTELTCDDVDEHGCCLIETERFYGSKNRGAENHFKMIQRFQDAFGENND